MNQEFMKEKKVLPLVISMSLPMVISMGVNALYNIVDSYFVAKLSENAMTALSLVYPVQNMVTAIGVGFGIGMNASVAFYLGADDGIRANKAAAQGIFFNFLHGIVLTFLCILGMSAYLKLFSSQKETIIMALVYANRAFLFSTVVTLGISFEKLFQAVGKMKITMIGMMCGFVANIILDPLMIFGIGVFPAMGIAGAAYATGIGQCITLFVYLMFYRKSHMPVSIERKYMRPEKEVARKLYSVGIPATLNMALPSFLISALNGILTGFSEKYVLVLGIYYKLQTFIYLTANGIIQGIRPLIGYNYGAGEHRRVEEIYKTTLKLTIGVMALGLVLAWAVPKSLVGLFTSNQKTLQMGVEALHIISLGFAASAVSVTCSGVLEGLGKGTPSLFISLARYVLVIIPAAFLFSRFLGAKGVWYGFFVTEFLAAVFSALIYKKEINRKYKA